MYYEINEIAAKHAKQAYSFYDYKPGSATAEYRSMVDKAADIAQRQKESVDPMYHDKIDHYLDMYARKLAENMNHGYEIEARVPSVMIAGPANFPVRKKEKQNAAHRKNMEEWQYIQGLLDKIRSTGMGGISSDDPNALDKLESKLEALQDLQSHMKLVNAYYKKHGTCKGCEGVSDDMAAQIERDIAAGYSWEKKPYPSYTLTNNNAKIKSVQQRIENMKAMQKSSITGWKFNGGEVVMNTAENRIQILFDGKPDEDMRKELKSRGFRWAPSQGAWQRKLNQNGIYAARQIPAIAPKVGDADDNE